MIFPVVAALCSAATFAVGSALQHRAASAVSTEESGQRVIARLFRRRSWVFGLVLSAVAFGLHALALSRGELALVQPVIVSGIVFAVLFRAALDRHLPRPPGDRLADPDLGRAGPVRRRPVEPVRARPAASTMKSPSWSSASIVAGADHACGRPGEVRSARGLLLGAAAGTLFGLVAGLLKLVTVQAQSGLGHALGHWSLWVLIVVGGVCGAAQPAGLSERAAVDHRTDAEHRPGAGLDHLRHHRVRRAVRRLGAGLRRRDRRAGADGHRDLATGRAAVQRFADRRATERSRAEPAVSAISGDG